MTTIQTSKTILIAKLFNSLMARGGNLNSLAKDIGIPQPTLWKLMHGKSTGNEVTWGKIEKFYEKRNGKEK